MKSAPGATHAPHHPTREWVGKTSQMRLFDDGSAKLRERILANRKRLGVVPQSTRLIPWPKEHLKPWDQLTDTARRPCAAAGAVV